MGGPVIETVRTGVQFTPEAAAAFRRAEAQVRAEFGRDIDVNSTYRDYNKQLSMYNAWQAYITGRGPHPGHSKALHPDDPLAFHTKGTALDSDDWRNARIVQILAENGFIRNRLHVPNERHHFEYLRNHDQHKNAPAGGMEDDMNPNQDKALSEAWENSKRIRQILEGLENMLVGNGSAREIQPGGSLHRLANIENAILGDGTFLPPQDGSIAKRVADIHSRVNFATRPDGTPYMIAVQGDVDVILAAIGAIRDDGSVDVDALADRLRGTLGAAVAEELASRLAT